MTAATASKLPGIPFSTTWLNALSRDAATRMPWIVQSLKGGVWRMYYRAETKEEANELALCLRNALGKMPHIHAIRVVHERTWDAGISLPALKKEKDNEDPGATSAKGKKK